MRSILITERQREICRKRRRPWDHRDRDWSDEATREGVSRAMRSRRRK